MGSFGFRKSKSFGPVRFTATHRGIGVSGGIKGVRAGINSNGRVSGSAGIPGTGLSYRTSKQLGSKHAAAAPGAEAPAPAPENRAARRRQPGVGGRIVRLIGVLIIILIVLSFMAAACTAVFLGGGQ